MKLENQIDPSWEIYDTENFDNRDPVNMHREHIVAVKHRNYDIYYVLSEAKEKSYRKEGQLVVEMFSYYHPERNWKEIKTIKRDPDLLGRVETEEEGFELIAEMTKEYPSGVGDFTYVGEDRFVIEDGEREVKLVEGKGIVDSKTGEVIEEMRENARNTISNASRKSAQNILVSNR